MSSGRRAFPTFGGGLAIVLLTIGCGMAAGWVHLIVTLALKEKHEDMVAHLVGLLSASGSAVLVLAWARAARRERLRLLVVPKPVMPALLVLAVVATLGADLVVSQIGSWVRWLIPPGPFFRKLMFSLGQGSLPLVLANVAVVGPVSEELIFRGVVLRGFLENYRAWVAILLSSFLFAFIHLNPWQAASGFVLGCLFAWFVARTGSLLPVITGHVLTNGLGIVAMRLDAKIPGITTEGFQPWWLTALGLLVMAGGILAFHRATRAARVASAEEPVASADRKHEPL